MSGIATINNLTRENYVHSIITKNAYASDTTVSMRFTCWSIRSEHL